jgi:hypothetical protein
MSYTKWAIRLAKHFFGPQFANQRVRLMITRAVLDQNFPDLGGTKGFLQAMRDGPEWLLAANQTMYQQGLNLHADWQKSYGKRRDGYPRILIEFSDAPPYLPYLCLLCFAWTEGDETIEPHAYYPRLETLYSHHGFAGGHRLGNWLPLWKGIELWTGKLDAHWGVFVVEILGGCVHVGIPRSQVIFTPTKIERFPELFLHCGFEAEATISRDQLRQVVLACERFASSVLGPVVFREIQRNNPLGNSALDVICEHLENWDGDSPHHQVDAGGRIGGPAHGETLLLALRPIDDNSLWQATFALDRDARCERITFTARRWKVRPHSETLATITDAVVENVDAAALSAAWITGLILHGKLQDAEVDDPEITYKLAANPLRFFDKWVGDWLVEGKRLPSEGPVYVLVHASMLADWQGWLALSLGAIGVQDVTWSGLPKGQYLFCIADVCQLSAQVRAGFPGGAGAVIGQTRSLRLASGTRCNSSTARRVYAEYDPPLLIVQASSTATLSVTGAKTTPLDGKISPIKLPGNTVRAFALTIETDQAVVAATLEDNGKQIGGVAFGVHHEQALLDNSAPMVFFDRLGNVSKSSGVNGLMVPERESKWSFTNGSHQIGNLISDSTWKESSLRFIDSLSLHGHRLAYPEYKRRAVQIANAQLWRISEETRWLAQLGFVDLQTDSRGRWSHVHPVPSQLYPLPWLAEGRFQFVLAGTAGIECLKKTTQFAVDELSCEARVTPSKLKLVPPRITLLHSELIAGEVLASEMGLQWTAKPPAGQLADWTGNLEEWLKQITWFPDPGPNPFAEYSPEEFRLVQGHQFAAPWHLRRFRDLFTMQQWHCLYQPEGCRYVDGHWEEHGEQHAYVRDFTWAMWRVHMAIAEDDGLTGLAYDPRTSRLIVPYQLNFPYLLGRALAACSGLPPETLFNCAPYMDHAAGVLLPDAAPYPGQCIAYQLVPRPIAQMIASKVNARLVDVSL